MEEGQRSNRSTTGPHWLMYVLLLRALRRPGRSPQTPTQRQTGYLAWYSSRVGASPCSSQCIGQLVHVCTEAAFSDAPTPAAFLATARCTCFLQILGKHNGSGGYTELFMCLCFFRSRAPAPLLSRQQLRRRREELFTSRNKINSSLAMALHKRRMRQCSCSHQQATHNQIRR